MLTTTDNSPSRYFSNIQLMLITLTLSGGLELKRMDANTIKNVDLPLLRKLEILFGMKTVEDQRRK